MPNENWKKYYDLIPSETCKYIDCGNWDCRLCSINPSGPQIPLRRYF
ncbi:MAG: hypothetical protein GTN36_00090 [Candidatus Aenigmarchaeota archaeon]|nr:hypothetical protein [Candidatus Aenigmarchaeota archaeon]